MNKNAGQMRLQREAKMAVKDIESQIKKHGKIKDQNFICLPDPEDLFTWYYVVFDMPDEYQGGFYIGKIKLPKNYPANAPTITVFTDNGKFRTHKL
jgi:ubiquitin-protein ligase